ncbi:MAG: hypothetical protein K0U34_00980 [Alphaproteobacteria bacterium]|nr:hypothetical protein [Alphaproteobacteria bacterium]
MTFLQPRNVAGFLMLALFAVLAATQFSHADPAAPPTVMVILDGSGSMWGKLAKEPATKLALSQTNLIAALAKTSSNLKLGFASFGHRRAGHCQDAQVLVPPAAGTVGDVTTLISKLNPRGKGPLTLALRNAAEAVPPDAHGAIVLVHDGADNCRQDPCQAAADIAQSHPKMAVHLISLDLEPAAAVAMSCIAKNTGGTATSVKTEAALKSAIQSAMAIAMLQPPVAADRLKDSTEPDQSSQAAADKGPARIRIVAGFKTDSGNRIRDVDWTVASPAEPSKVVLQQRATELASKIPAGRYTVTATAGLASAHQQITVADQGETRARLILDAGTLVLESRKLGPNSADKSDPVFYSLRRPAKPDSADDGRPIWIGSNKNATQLILPSGAFELEIERGAIKRSMPVTITSGQATPIDTALEESLLVLESLIATAPDSEPAAAQAQPSVSYVLSTDDPSSAGGRREIGRSASPNAKFQLQPGTYYAEATLGQAKQEYRFAIGADQVVHHQFRFKVSRVTLEATVGETAVSDSIPVTYRALSLNSAPARVVVTTSQRTPHLILPHGRYRFEAEVDGTVYGKGPELSLESGTSQKVAIPIQAGLVTLKPDQALRRGSLPRVQIRNQTGDVVWRGRPGRDTKTLLAPGTYSMEHRGIPSSRALTFTVQEGQATVVDIAPNS